MPLGPPNILALHAFDSVLPTFILLSLFDFPKCSSSVINNVQLGPYQILSRSGSAQWEVWDHTSKRHHILAVLLRWLLWSLKQYHRCCSFQLWLTPGYVIAADVICCPIWYSQAETPPQLHQFSPSSSWHCKCHLNFRWPSSLAVVMASILMHQPPFLPRPILTKTFHVYLTAIVLGSKLYDSLTVCQFLAHTFHIGDSLFILLNMWASCSPRESPDMLVAQSLTMTPKTKHSSTKLHGTDNAAYNQWISSGGLMRRQRLQNGSV